MREWLHISLLGIVPSKEGIIIIIKKKIETKEVQLKLRPPTNPNISDSIPFSEIKNKGEKRWSSCCNRRYRSISSSRSYCIRIHTLLDCNSSLQRDEWHKLRDFDVELTQKRNGEIIRDWKVAPPSAESKSISNNRIRLYKSTNGNLISWHYHGNANGFKCKYVITRGNETNELYGQIETLGPDEPMSTCSL